MPSPDEMIITRYQTGIIIVIVLKSGDRYLNTLDDKMIITRYQTGTIIIVANLPTVDHSIQALKLINGTDRPPTV
jgi:hypothetical protein